MHFIPNRHYVLLLLSGSPVITTTTSRGSGNKDVELSDKKEAPRRLFKRPQQEFEESSWKIEMLLLGTNYTLGYINGKKVQ